VIRVVFAFVAVVCTGCGVFVSGDFNGVPWNPDATIVVVADRLQLLDREGAVVAVKEGTGAQSLDILLTGARLDPQENWRDTDTDTLLEWKRDLATKDGLLLRGVPLARFEQNDALKAVLDEGQVTGDFDMDISSALPPADSVAKQGLGAKMQVTLLPKSISVTSHGGSLSADIEVQRLRETGQDGNVAVGTVDLNFGASFSPERLGEANVSVAAPVLKCAMQLGPERAGECRDAPPEAIVDETGTTP
jgi:hypothetical protein